MKLVTFTELHELDNGDQIGELRERVRELEKENAALRMTVSRIKTAIGSEWAIAEDKLPYRIHDLERVAICRALELAGGNRARAAKHLGIARSTLFEMMRRHQFHAGASRADGSKR